MQRLYEQDENSHEFQLKLHFILNKELLIDILFSEAKNALQPAVTCGLSVGFVPGFPVGFPVERSRSNCCSYFDRFIFARRNSRVNFFA